MSTLQELYTLVADRRQQDEELFSLLTQVKPLEQEVKKLQIDANNRQADADELSGPGLRTLFLRMTGKKEEAEAQAYRNLRTAKEQLNTASYRLETTKSRIEALQTELDATADAESALREALNTRSVVLPEQTDTLLSNLAQADVLAEQLPQTMNELKSLLQKVENYYIHGDIQTDLSGNRYNNRFRTMQQISRQCQPVLDRLLSQLNSTAALYDTDFRAAAPGDWTTDPQYLSAQRFDAKDLFERTDSVFCWLQRLERCLNTQKQDRAATELQWKQELRDILLAAVPSGM